MASATLINIFEVPDDVPDEEFIAWWVRTRDFLNARVGPIPTALHRAILALGIVVFAFLAYEGWHILTYLSTPWQ